ncbi:Tripeptidyl aminopeptidase [Streptomyces sp. enrichment culture]|uniref:alpha/beta hydrolase n=1 Tax=Streptomyces sp. enrichment culture TaxID=1795815 RepID=UPI003F57A26D
MKKTTSYAGLVAASAAALLFSGLTAPSTAAAATAAARSSLDWGECAGGAPDPRQRCATVEVPMDYSHPDGEKIDIVVSRIPSEKPSARRGALMLIPGGPGGSSLDDPSKKGQKLPQDVRDAYDLIGFAPRGLAPSTSVSCGLEYGDLALSRLRPWPAPDGSVAGNMADARRMADACARNGGELIEHLSTANEARDLDRVRAALGERKVSAWGVSYGTYVGAVYSRLFPHRTDRIVLDSNDDPDPSRVARAWLAGHEQGVEDVFPEFAKWASAPGNPHRVAETAAEVRPLFLRLAARLDSEPIPWPGANPEELNGNVLRQTMLDSLYSPARFPELARLMLAAEKGTVPPAPPAPPEKVLQNVAAVGAGTLCNDVAWPEDPAVYQKAVDESRARYPLTAGMPRNAMLCAAWPFAPKEPAVRITDRGPSNILLIQNERDVATPLSGALKLRAALGDRARMVTVDATGHDAYLAYGNACGDAAVSRFLATGERPEKDVYCE